MITQSLKITAVVLLLAGLSACGRMQIIPSDPPPGTGPEVIPPLVEQPTVTQPAEPIISQPTPSMPVSGASMHTVQAGENLYRIGLRYGYDYREIARWNSIPPPYNVSPGQRLVVSPPGMGGSQPVASLPPATPTPAARYHTVQRGDTLYSIGRRYGISFQQIAAWNNIAPPYNLNVGQRLVVSQSGDSMTPAPAPQPTIVEWIPPSQRQSAPPSGGTATYHTVQPGDTLYAVARRYGQNYRDIAAWNNIPPPYTLRVGQSLQVSTGGGMTSMAMYGMSGMSGMAGILDSAGTHYTVQRGESLYQIAQDHNRGYQELAAWNNLRPPYELRVGQKLQVCPPTTLTAQQSGKLMAKAAPVKPASSPMKSVAGTKSALGSKSPVGSPSKTYHTVQHGESLASIAAKYNQSTHELALWNGIAPPYILKPGQTLLVVE